MRISAFALQTESARKTEVGVPTMVSYVLAEAVSGERDKGDHRHTENTEEPYVFSTPDQLVADFEADITRWNYEHGRS